MTTTPNMGLAQPAPGSLGPTWATDINSNSSTLDTHDHSAGKGVPITPSGININSDFSVQNFTLTDAKSVRFVSQTTSIAGTGAQDVYVKNGDLFYARGGTDVQITNGGSIAGASGSIAGLVSPASCVFSGQQYSFFYDAGTYADLRCRDLILSTNGGNTVKLTQASTASYTCTLPASPPSTSTQLVAMGTTGTLSAPANPTLGDASSVFTWQGSTQSTAIGNGAVVIAGGVSVAKTLRADSCRISNGLSVTTNGLSIDAGGLAVTGPTTLTGTALITGLATLNSGLNVTNGLTIVTGGLGISANGATINGTTAINGFTTFTGGTIINGFTTINGITTVNSQLVANNIVCGGINTDNTAIRQRRVNTTLDGSGNLVYAHGISNTILSVTGFFLDIGFWRDFPLMFSATEIRNLSPTLGGLNQVRLFITYEA